MKELPLVSIIIPSYNQGEFIEDAILSIKNQDYPNIEHIIIDGQSTDNTLEVIKKYEGTYNMRWISESDSGPLEAFNKGLRKAQGEILGLSNADDLYLPWAVSVAVGRLMCYPEVELIYGDTLNMNLETGLNRLAFFPRVDLPFMIRKRGLVPTPAAFFRKSVLKKAGLFDENLRVGADYEYWIRVFQQCEVLKIEEVLAVDRFHLKNIRAHKRQQLLEESDRVRQSYGAPKGIRGYPVKSVDTVRGYIDRKILAIKFAFYYWMRRRKSSPRNSVTYPWQNLIEFSGFQVTSWIGFLILMLPWTTKRYKRNWFVLSMMGSINANCISKKRIVL